MMNQILTAILTDLAGGLIGALVGLAFAVYVRRKK